MKAKALCIIAAATMIATAAAAQDVKRPDSYNYTRGVEAVQGGNVEEAMEYLGKELQDNPKNGYASIWMAVAYNNQGELGRALSMVSHAVENIPKKDKEYVALAFMGRGNLYGSLGKTDEALADYTSAIRANPESIDAYEKRGDLYYSMGKLELAEADYRKMIEIDPGSVNGYVGLGLTAELEGRHTDAIGCYDYAIKLDPGLSFAHSARANAYIALGEYEKASEIYEKVLLTSIQELNDSLNTAKTSKNNYGKSLDRLNLEKEKYSLSEKKLNIGAKSQLEHLKEEENLILSERAEISNKINCLISTINLYKAVGGVDYNAINKNEEQI